MKVAPLLTVTALICLLLLNLPVTAAETKEKVVLYQTDFSSDPGWTTNSPRNYYWDPSEGVYHYKIEGGTAGYAYKNLPYDGESFELEFDVFPNKTDKESAFRFGMGSQEMDVTRATDVLAELMYKKSLRLMGLRVISQNNNMAEITSQYYSYCGTTPNCETKEFSDGVPYHVIVRYNKELQNADIKFQNGTTGETVWGYYTNINQELSGLDRLLISSKGEYMLNIAAEGWIDNVTFSVLREKKVVPTTVPTTVEQTTTQVTTIATTVPETTTVPTTKSPAPAMLVLAALGISVLMAAGYRRP